VAKNRQVFLSQIKEQWLERINELKRGEDKINLDFRAEEIAHSS